MTDALETDDASTPDAPSPDAPSRGAVIAVAAVFAVLFGLATLGPVSNLVALPQVYQVYGIGDAVPWALLVAGVVIPPLLYVAGLLLGRGRLLVHRAIVLVVALATTFALGFGLIAWVAALQPALG